MKQVQRPAMSVALSGLMLAVFSLSNLIKVAVTLDARIQSVMSDDPGFAQSFLITILYVFVSTPLFVLLAAQRLQSGSPAADVSGEEGQIDERQDIVDPGEMFGDAEGPTQGKYQ